jgi:hypothetical protein
MGLAGEVTPRTIVESEAKVGGCYNGSGPDLLEHPVLQAASYTVHVVGQAEIGKNAGSVGADRLDTDGKIGRDRGDCLAPKLMQASLVIRAFGSAGLPE